MPLAHFCACGAFTPRALTPTRRALGAKGLNLITIVRSQLQTLTGIIPGIIPSTCPWLETRTLWGRLRSSVVDFFVGVYARSSHGGSRATPRFLSTCYHKMKTRLLWDLVWSRFSSKLVLIDICKLRGILRSRVLYIYIRSGFVWPHLEHLNNPVTMKVHTRTPQPV